MGSRRSYRGIAAMPEAERGCRAWAAARAGSGMPTPAERQALLFLALVTATGVVVRRVEARRVAPDVESREALATQLALVDSAIAARASGTGRGPRGRVGTPANAPPGATFGAASVSPPTPSPPGLVDVDLADAAALEALPWVGPALAARIVTDREANGAFGSLAGLQRVRGIGPVLAGRLAGRVTFSGTPRPPSVTRPPAARRGSP